MVKIQEKMKDCLEKQNISMDSLERLSNAMHTSTTSTTISSADDDDKKATTNALGVTRMTTDDEVELE